MGKKDASNMKMLVDLEVPHNEEDKEDAHA